MAVVHKSEAEVVKDIVAVPANADFARDVEAGINVQREPWNPPS